MSIDVVRDLAQKILSDHVKQERLKVVESGSEWFDRETWNALAQSNLARVRAKLDVLKLFNWKQAWSMTHGKVNFAEASTVKVFGSELNVEGYQLLLEVVGELGALRKDSAMAVLSGRLERMYKSALILTFGGGTNEVQRDIIAMAGLGMPHYRR